ncbi:MULTISPECIES: TetR/AcrR family transcriptional regulator [unclassified Microbacterium]|uniref:TetR/AcrR family transcriptional regulator n=1 Tax=unclassified Microbacterium TaxID=2609290 RepID=UPI000EAAB3DF|nr:MULTISPECIES: TetR/AcrR family transcriptional regulator [unclassified Microbacterium]RKN69088.1 TetR/AcrR family transcriptional regulator [Microbacterium sp. CGR2]
MPAMLPQNLRSDAKENRDRVLAAARELFGTDGLDVTMRQIARRAGVGPATLYRRFPTKADLVRAAFVNELDACRSIVVEALADTDPWRGFRGIIEQVLVLNARNQGFTDAFLSAYPDAVDFRAQREDAVRAIVAVARRAIDVGALRADFVLDDFLIVLLAARGPSSTTEEERTRTARRYAALVIDGLRASDRHGPLPPAPRLIPSVIPG